MDPQPSNPSSEPARTRFEEQWRERFMEFATQREDDAGIAGWSLSGLETRFRFFRRLWSGAAPGSLYLDVGCGAGTYTRWLSDQGLQVVGLDYSQPTLKKARQRMSPGIPLCAGDATRLPFADASFDGGLCAGVSATEPFVRVSRAAAGQSALLTSRGQPPLSAGLAGMVRGGTSRDLGWGLALAPAVVSPPPRPRSHNSNCATPNSASVKSFSPRRCRSMSRRMSSIR